MEGVNDNLKEMKTMWKDLLMLLKVYITCSKEGIFPFQLYSHLKRYWLTDIEEQIHTVHEIMNLIYHTSNRAYISHHPISSDSKA